MEYFFICSIVQKWKSIAPNIFIPCRQVVLIFNFQFLYFLSYVAEWIPGRTDVQCLHRWQKVLNPEIIKGPWTKEVNWDHLFAYIIILFVLFQLLYCNCIQEDDHITKLVEANGCMKWSLIAKDLPGRIGKQCRER